VRGAPGAVHGRRRAAVPGTQPRHRPAGGVPRRVRRRDRGALRPVHGRQRDGGDRRPAQRGRGHPAAVPAAGRRAAGPVPRRPRRAQHPGLVPAARDGDVGLGAGARRLRPLRAARTPRCVRRTAGRHRLHRLRARRLRARRSDHDGPLAGADRRRVGDGGCRPRGRDGGGVRARGSVCAVAPRARHPGARARPERPRAAGGPPVTPKPYTHKDAVPYRPLDWTGLYPPAYPKGAVPNHVALVMDGNGRWANRRGLTRIEGHRAGESTLLDVVAGAIQAGVRHLSVYAFSTENWARSPDEVRFLMGFNREVLHRRRDQLNEWGVQVRWAGRRPRLWGSVVRELEYAQRLTAGNDVLTLTMCVNYGGRVELIDAMRSIAEDVDAGRLKPSAVSEKLVQRRLYVPDMPDVDLFVRSSGEQRTSNFLLWESAYAEFVFLDTLFPDFDRRDLWRACEIYASRDRRYGGALPNSLSETGLGSPVLGAAVLGA